MKLNEAEQNFLQNCVIRSFEGTNKHDLSLAIYNKDGQVVFSTNQFCQELGINNSEQLLNKTLFEINDSEHACYERFNLQQDIITKQCEISYMLLVDGNKTANSDYKLIRHTPIFMPDGSVIGSLEKGYSKDIMFRNFAEIITDEMHDITQVCPSHSKPLSHFKLTEKQHEIVFLLYLGLSQCEIAEILNISRGSVTKTIGRDINPKFNIEGNSSIYLMEKIIALNIRIDIPERFKKNKIIILERKLIH